ncbi:MAG: hypothetical protein EOO65_00995, partial [Methanosarcinales archaeon]
MACLLVVIVDGDERIVVVTPLLGLQQKLIVAMHSSTKIAAAWGEAWARAHWNALLQKHETRIQQAQRVAIIVPYRHQAKQNRAAQLARFLAYMPAYLSRHTQAFHIFIVELVNRSLKFLGPLTLIVDHAGVSILVSHNHREGRVRTSHDPDRVQEIGIE